MESTLRRYDLDWLRMAAIGLLLIYHVSIVFQPWGVLIGFVQNDKSLESLWTLMSMVNIWRIPLLFFISGMGLAFAGRKRSGLQLIGERSRRILLPLVFSSLVIVPVQAMIWQKYYHQELSWFVHPGHLWFLANIYIYALLIIPLFSYMKKYENCEISSVLRKIFSSPYGLLFPVFGFCLEALIIRPESFELYAMTLHGFLLGFLAFFSGFCMAFFGKGLWKFLGKFKFLLLSLALVFYMVRITTHNLIPFWLHKGIESNLWIFGITGLGFSCLNRPGRILSYLSRGAYPVYILHMIFLFLGSTFILPLALGEWIKFFILLLFTTGASLAVYEFIVRRFSLTRYLFGLRPELKPESEPNSP